MSKKLFLQSAALVLAASLPALAQFAQTTGRITDPSASVVPGAKVTIRNIETGVVTETTSNADGYYSAPPVSPGNYEIRVQHDGSLPVLRAKSSKAR